MIDVSDATIQYQEELSELQHDESVRTLSILKCTKMWLYDEVERKHANISTSARELLIPFHSSYLVECGFSAVDNFLEGKRNRLEITTRGDLRLKLTKLIIIIMVIFKCYFSGEHIALSINKNNNGVNIALGKTNRLKALCMMQINT